MTEELKGERLNGWLVGGYIDCGKSALVLHAEKDGLHGAIKIFDRELIERFGREVQTERIRREMLLIGKRHPHLIEILDGGYDRDHNAHFVVMNYFEGTNLEKVRSRIPPDRVRSLVSQVAAAARYLESLGLAHRDIKPSNIGIDLDLKHTVLLDLGVVRPVGTEGVTDEEATRVFIGTLQYSSPEFLLREEIDSPEGWRAVTFYQLGGVLHDLIVRKPLFDEFTQPFARLSNAVQREVPVITPTDVSSDLVELARNCLVKKPSVRLQLVNWDSFAPNPMPSTRIDQMRQRIAARQIRAAQESIPAVDRSTLAWKLNDYANEILSVFRHTCIGNPDFPPLSTTDNSVVADHITRFCVHFEPSTRHALAAHLKIVVQLQWVDIADDVVSIEVVTLLSMPSVQIETVSPLPLAGVYTGKFSRDPIASRLAEVLYLAFDWAQSQSLGPSPLLIMDNALLIRTST